mmetsp:Transcript_38955/g.57259  ORF Transcript_38955/g.57259 Transcript_38955/m.57259 type:complete len:233 (+) Transcript_38955:501-1199(+)
MQMSPNDNTCKFFRPRPSSPTSLKERRAAGIAMQLMMADTRALSIKYPRASSFLSMRSCTICGRKIATPKKHASKHAHPPAAPMSRVRYCVLSPPRISSTSFNFPLLPPLARASRYSLLSDSVPEFKRISLSANIPGNAPIPSRNLHPTSVAHGSSVTRSVPNSTSTASMSTGAMMLPTICTATASATRRVRPSPRSSCISPAMTAVKGYVPPTPIPRINRQATRLCQIQFP